MVMRDLWCLQFDILNYLNHNECDITAYEICGVSLNYTKIENLLSEL